MTKISTFSTLALLLGSLSAYGSSIETAGNGTTYTLESLAALPNSPVEYSDGVYLMKEDVTIVEGDNFSIGTATALKLADGVTFEIKGTSDFNAESTVLISRIADTDTPSGLRTYGGVFKNINFEYVGVKDLSSTGITVENCAFRYTTGTAALSTGPSGSQNNIKNCVFEYNQGPAIQGAANYFSGLLIEDCTFTDNNQSNTNKPQLNLTVGDNLSVIVRNCTITGAQRNMVGGIAVGNLVGGSATSPVIIENCTITGHRYGLTGTGPMAMVIRNNHIVDNQYETNPNSGGSGISLYDPYLKLTAVVSGNEIKKNLWGITVIGCSDVNLGQVDNENSPGNNVFGENGNSGVLYDLYNNSTNTIYAQNNTWGVDEQTAEKIETVIYHKADNSSLGEVIYMPANDSNGVDSTTLDSKLTIEVNNNTLYSNSGSRVDIYSLNGEKITSAVLGESGLSLSGLAKGVYVIRVSGNGENAVMKYMKY
jgi:hypothetical protein